jgi:multidrug efflux system outer membrane protein
MLVLALAGCSTTEYQRPAMPVPDAFPAATHGKGTVAARDWQAYFTDPELQTLIAAALEHNRDLRIAVGRVEEARALAGIALADRIPGVDFVTQRTASLTPADLSATGRELGAQRYDANLAVTSFELDFWGRMKSLDAAARANFLASDYARRAFELGLIADVAQAWFTRLETGERLALATATAKSREATRTLIDKRRAVGLAGDLDYLQADGAYQTARGEAASLARSRAAAENALRLLVGGTAPVSAHSLASVAPMQELAVGLPAEVLLARPDVLAAEQKLIAAHANLDAARAAFFPKIVLTASVGTASKELANLFAAGSRAWSFVPVLRLPLFDASRAAENRDLAAARTIIAVAEYEKAVQQAFREVADLLVARDALNEQLQAQQANLAAQNQRLKLVEARYNAGVSSHLELLDAQRDSFAAQQSALAVKRQALAAAAGLFKALGGT